MCSIFPERRFESKYLGGSEMCIAYGVEAISDPNGKSRPGGDQEVLNLQILKTWNCNWFVVDKNVGEKSLLHCMCVADLRKGDIETVSTVSI